MNKLNIIMQKLSFSNRTLLGKFCGIFAITLCTYFSIVLLIHLC